MRDEVAKITPQMDAEAILEAITQAYIKFDNDCRFRYLNRAAEALLGRSQDSLLGKRIWDEFPATVGTAFEGQCRQVASQGGPATFDYFFQSRDQWYEVQTYPTSDGGFAASFSDITAPQSDEEKLNHFENHDALLENITEGLVRFDNSFRYIYANKAAEDILRRPRTELIGNLLWDLYPDIVGTEIELNYRRAMVQRTPVKFEMPNATVGGDYQINIFPDRKGGLAVFFQDVSERHRMKEELVRSRELASLAADAGLFGSFIWDIAADRVAISQEICTLYGLNPASVKENSFFWLNCIHPDDRDRVQQTMKECFKKRRSFTSYDFRIVGNELENRWIHCRANLRYDDYGSPLLMVGINVDISESKRREEELQKSHAELSRLSRLVELAHKAAKAGTWEWNLDTGEMIWTEQYRRLLGVGPNVAPTPAHFFSYVHPEDLPLVKKHIEDARNGGIQESRTEYRAILRDGIHWFERVAQVITDVNGKPIRLVGISTDITDRKRAEEALLETEQRFRTLADNISQFAWMTDAEGWIFWYNQRWYEYTGTTLEEMQGWGWQKVHHPDHVDRVVQRFKSALQTGEPWEDTFPIRGKTGEWRWFLSRALPVRDEAGEIVMWFGTNTDVTELREAELVLEQRSHELARSNDDLERFAYMAAHDLREPLRTVSSFSELLVRRHPASDAETQGYVSYIKQGINRMTNLINDLLGYSSIAHDGYKPFEIVDLNAALSQALGNLEATIRENDANVTSEPLPNVRGDSQLLCQVFQNLLGNAIKYRRDETPQVHVSVKLDHLDWVISVKDNGIGFEMHYAEKIFGVFRRLHTQSAIEGSGVGLATVKRIIDRHGGTVWAESEVGKGSTFHFRLPLIQDEDGASTSA